MLWYCFGVGFANFGSPPAPSVDALRSRDHDPRIEFLASYRSTGNYVVRAAKDASDLLRRELDRLTHAEERPRWAVVTERAVEDALRTFEVWGPPEADPQEPLIRWTPGLAFAVQVGAGSVPLSRTYRAELQCVDGQAVAAYKRDLEIRPGVLDRKRRLGGWGAVSHEIERQVGGKWTARSLSVVRGLTSAVREDAARRPGEAPA